MGKVLHVVSFDVPYPPNYGGVIDVYYKIKALANLGTKIYLHCYNNDRKRSIELEEFCEKIFYYKRNSFVLSLFSSLPFRVKSRSSNLLLKNLDKIKAPILFEGLHTTFPLLKNEFSDIHTMVRTHNIEHRYYDGLSKSENRIDKKLFFKSEAKKLAIYEQVLNKSDHILTISPYEQEYFREKFKDKAIYIPVFHQNKGVNELTKKGKHALYHGDLRVADNIKSVNFLIDVFNDLDYHFIIASSFKNDSIQRKIKKCNHIEFIKINDQREVVKIVI